VRYCQGESEGLIGHRVPTVFFITAFYLVLFLDPFFWHYTRWFKYDRDCLHLFTRVNKCKQSRSYLNHLVELEKNPWRNNKKEGDGVGA